MDTIKIEKKSARIIAHRGLSGIEPENTNAAFVAAGNRSYYGIETDIHKTLDGEFVVSHDNHLMRTAGVEIDTESSTLAELQSIPLFDSDGIADRIDLRTPTLKNYIKISKRYEKRSVLELKDDFTDGDIAGILEAINEYDYLESVTFISFVYDNLVKVKAQYPDAKCEYLFSDPSTITAEKLKEDGFNVDIYHGVLTKELLLEYHNAGLTVNCWTVNEKERAEELISYGIDYITTNILE
jgi:glycerophosphoryl diester phosphodiesterase